MPEMPSSSLIPRQLGNVSLDRVKYSKSSTPNYCFLALPLPFFFVPTGYCGSASLPLFVFFVFSATIRTVLPFARRQIAAPQSRRPWFPRRRITIPQCPSPHHPPQQPPRPNKIIKRVAGDAENKMRKYEPETRRQ